jgi:hypothetical protein
MDMSDLNCALCNIEDDEFAFNKILINLILQMFIKNNVDDPNDIILTIAQYLECETNTSFIHNLASKLNIMWTGNTWVWIQ